MQRTSLLAAALAGLLASGPALAQEEGGGGGTDEGSVGEIDYSAELDYTGAEDAIFDEESFSNTESQLHVGQGSKGQGYASYLHMGTVQLGGPAQGGYQGGGVPAQYVVQPGDTLLDIAARFFGNPDLWPEIWSINPDITNPNWIYPGQLIVLQKQSLTPQVDEQDKPKVVFATKWKPGTVVFRNPGFVDEEIEEASGEIVSAFAETKYLSHLNTVYIKYEEGKAPGIGATATVYKIEKDVKDPKKKKKTYGKLVKILGTVKVNQVDEEHRLAKATITESMYPIERGDLVGPMKWKLAVVAPVAASLDLEGKIIESYDPITNLGSQHVVFVDIGYEDGVVEGNHLYIVRKGDPYMKSLDKKDGDPDLPWETIGKAIVLESLKKTATCLLVESEWDVQVGDKVELRRGE